VGLFIAIHDEHEGFDRERKRQLAAQRIPH
jgi:hypothetical protein